MSLADAAPAITALGGIGGIAAAFRWWFDRAERIRREDLAREDARAEASARRYEEMGRAMAATAETLRALAGEIARTPAGLDALGSEVAAMHRTLAAIEARLSPPTGEHRAGAVS